MRLLQRCFPVFPLILLTLLQGGCVVARYTRIAPPPNRILNPNLASAPLERVTFSVYALFADEKATKIAIDKATAKTTTGVTIGTVETDIDDQAVQAVVSGVVQGVVKGLK